MISVGSGVCVLFEANQLQADKQANVASKRTLNRTPTVRYDDITVSRRRIALAARRRRHASYAAPFESAANNDTTLPGVAVEARDRRVGFALSFT
jgi:hypothetical protein